MSVVVVRRYENEIVLASDRQITYGKQKTLCDSKFFQVGDVIVGFTGASYESMLFRNYLSDRLNNDDLDLEDAYDWNEAIFEFQTVISSKKKDFECTNSHILIQNNRIFYSTGSFVQEVMEYMAIGSGSQVALGVLYLGGTPSDAVKAACEYDTGCSGGPHLKIIIY